MDKPNTRPRWTAGLVPISVVATLAAGYIATRKQANDVDELRKEVVDLRKLEQERPGVVREIRTVLREHQGRSESAPPLPVADDEKNAPEPARPPSPEEAQHRAEVLVAAREKALTDTYARETPDPDWSAAATASLRSAYSAPEFAGLTTESECRTTMCRVNFSYADVAAAEQWRQLVQRTPWSGATNYSVNNETRKGSIYLAREGFDLPTVDPSTLEF